jgi:hypothetical protein
MEEIKVLKRDIEMEVINTIKSLKDTIKEQNKLTTGQDCPENVRKAIEAISNKMNQCKFS